MTLDEIRANVLADLGDPDGDIWTNESGNPRLDRLIDRAYEKLINAAIAVDAQFLQASVIYSGGTVGTLHAYALPDDFRRVVSLYWTDQGPPQTPPRSVQIVDRQVFDLYRGIDDGEVAYIQHESGTGTFNIYLPTGSNIYYVLFYTRRPASLIGADSSTTAIELPAEFHYLIVQGAVILALLQENADASGFKALYDEGLREMLATFKRSTALAGAAG